MNIERKVHMVVKGSEVDMTTTCGNTGGTDLGCAKIRFTDEGPELCSPCSTLQDQLDYVDYLTATKQIPMEIPDTWAFTLTFKRDPGGWIKPHEQMRATQPKIAKMLKRCAGDQWSFWPELQPTSCRIHYHGWLQVKDKIKFYKNFFPQMKRNGFTVFKKLTNIVDKTRWIGYCSKEQKESSVMFAPTKQPINIMFDINNM